MEKTKVLILGTVHLDPPGKDFSNSKKTDVNAKAKEIDELVEKISLFKPTKIVCECPRAKSDKVNEDYRHYCNNEKCSYVKEGNEVYQIVFKLAKKQGHKMVYPIDVPMGIPLEEVFDCAKESDKEVYDMILNAAKKFTDIDNKMQTEKTVLDYYRYLNSKEFYDNDHSSYLMQSRVGAGIKYYGVNMLTEWYRRNIYIFANLQDIASSGDRILVLYGAGHGKILREFVNDYNGFELVQASDYLK